MARDQIKESTSWFGIKSRNLHHGQGSNPGINGHGRGSKPCIITGGIHACGNLYHGQGSNPGISPWPGTKSGNLHHGQGSNSGSNTMARDQIQNSIPWPGIKSRSQHHGQGSNPGFIGVRNACERQAGIKSSNQHNSQGSNPGINIMSRDQMQDSLWGELHASIYRDQIQKSNPGN
jgi:hypothetical protein